MNVVIANDPKGSAEETFSYQRKAQKNKLVSKKINK